MKQCKSSQKASRKEKAINCIVTEAKANHRGNEAKYTHRQSQLYDFWFSVIAYVAPIILTIISLIVTNCFNWKVWIEIVVQVTPMIVAVGLGVFFAYKKSIYVAATSILKKDTQIKNNKIKELNQIVKQKEGDISFLITLLTNLGTHIARGESTMGVLANHLAVELYHDCLRRFGEDFEVTVNIYEKRNDIVAMIGHHQNIPLGHAPALFLCGETGMHISDERVKDFYFVDCINGRKDVNHIADWEKLVDAFKWHEVDKTKICISKEMCRKAGFTYNQYISSRIAIDHNNDHVMLLEIITHNDSIIDTADNIERTARKLFSIYTPLVVMLTTTASDRVKPVGKLTVSGGG